MPPAYQVVSIKCRKLIICLPYASPYLNAGAAFLHFCAIDKVLRTHTVRT